MLVREINKIIIHCSASDYRNYNFERIYHDHTAINGWDDIGYNFGIDWDGNIKVLRDISKVGAHTKGFNKGSVGICVLGNGNFSHEQMSGLASVVSCLMKAFDLNASHVHAHNEFNDNKTCPNFDVEEWKIHYLESKLCHWN